MPYRRLLDMMKARLALAAEGDGKGYASAREFIADLELIDASLANHRGEHAGRFALQRVLWRARTFGFHLAALDLRQDSAAHDAALAQLLGDPDWAGRDAAERTARLQALLADPPRPRRRRWRARLHAGGVPHRARHAPPARRRAIGLYIIS